MEIKKRKIYAVFISLLIIFQASGLYGLFGGILSPVRISAIIILIPFLSDKFLAVFLKKERFLISFIVFTLGYTFVLLLMYQSDKSINYLIYTFLNLIILVEIVFLSNFLKDIYGTIWKAYLIFISITIPIAIMELVFDIHLSVSYLDSNQVVGLIGIQKRFASVSFGNYNLYNFILVISVPILSSFFLSNSSKSTFLKWYTIVILLVMLVILVMNGSRASSVSYLLSMTVFSAYFFKNNRFNKLFFLRVILIIIPVIAVLTYYFLKSDISTYLFYRLSSVGFEDDVRSGLIEAGIGMLVESYFLGVGPANYEINLEKMGTSRFIIPPHNMFIEILAEFGIFVFIFFILFLFKIYKNLKNVPIHIKYILIASLITMPLNFVINSNYIYVVYMWIYFSVLYVLSKIRI